MARQARIDASGTLHHIIVRGFERRSILRYDINVFHEAISPGRLLVCMPSNIREN